MSSHGAVLVVADVTEVFGKPVAETAPSVSYVDLMADAAFDPVYYVVGLAGVGLPKGPMAPREVLCRRRVNMRACKAVPGTGEGAN